MCRDAGLRYRVAATPLNVRVGAVVSKGISQLALAALHQGDVTGVGLGVGVATSVEPLLSEPPPQAVSKDAQARATK